MQSTARLDRPAHACLLSLMLVLCIPYLLLTFVAPGARATLIAFAFPLWIIGLRPADRWMSRLFPIPGRCKSQKMPSGLGDLD